MPSEKRLPSTKEPKRIPGTAFSGRRETGDVTHVATDQVVTAGDREETAVVGGDVCDLSAGNKKRG